MIKMRDLSVANVETDNWAVSIHQDPHPADPREGGGNFSTIVDWHKDYDFGEEKIERGVYANEFEALKHHLPKDIENYIYLPIYLLDHTVLRLNTTGFRSSWDSAQVGWIYISKEDAEEWIGKDYSVEEVKERLRKEIDLLDMWCLGDAYGFEVSEKSVCGECGHVEYSNVDGCYGFFGHDFEDNGLLEMLEDSMRSILGVEETQIEKVMSKVKEEL